MAEVEPEGGTVGDGIDEDMADDDDDEEGEGGE
jgi:hypothetical protein